MTALLHLAAAWVALWIGCDLALRYAPAFSGETRRTRCMRHAVLLLAEPWHSLRRFACHLAGLCRELYPPRHHTGR